MCSGYRAGSCTELSPQSRITGFLYRMQKPDWLPLRYSPRLQRAGGSILPYADL